jgi:hypothetical protein
MGPKTPVVQLSEMFHQPLVAKVGSEARFAKEICLTRKLIVIGGSSRLIRWLLSESFVKDFYTDIVSIVGGASSVVTSPQELETVVYVADGKENSEAVGTSLDSLISNYLPKVGPCDVIFAATPSNGDLYNSESVLYRVLRVVFSRVSSNGRHDTRVYIFGTNLIFVPFLGDKKYKLIKKIEYHLFLLHLEFSSKLFYLVIPPIGRVKSKLGQCFSTNERVFIADVVKLLGSNRDSCIVFLGNRAAKMLSKAAASIYKLMR